jgi:uncharacterized damage-inducible protein DinB
MTGPFRTGAVGALLDEYERALEELHRTISDISDVELCAIVDVRTDDEDCRSVQTILAHVVRSTFVYAVNIRRLTGGQGEFPERKFRTSIHQFREDLREGFWYTVEAFSAIGDRQIEEHDDSRKILTTWGQRYDIEQMMEHAIVHILRHRRQIERFKGILHPPA